MSEEHRSPLGAAIDSLASSYKQLLDATLAANRQLIVQFFSDS